MKLSERRSMVEALKQRVLSGALLPEDRHATSAQFLHPAHAWGRENVAEYCAASRIAQAAEYLSNGGTNPNITLGYTIAQRATGDLTATRGKHGRVEQYQREAERRWEQDERDPDLSDL